MSKTLHLLISGSILLLLPVTAILVVGAAYERKAVISVVENIDGIPFYSNGSTLITEKLAHADIFLNHGVIGKEAALTITFTPHEQEKIEVGIRENAFWLSYPWQLVYDRNVSDPGREPLTAKVIIPLTDKLQEKDRSVDLMFLARTSRSTEEIDEGVHDATLWELHDIKIEVYPVLPAWPQLKNYLHSIVTRERAL